jgi:hypothetical protein
MATTIQPPQKPEASWSYVPYSPTKGAWEARFFKGQCKLHEIPQLIKENVYQCEGQLVFRTESIPKSMKEKAIEIEGHYYVPYNHMTELYNFMEQINWNETKNLHNVVIYRMGYFIQ